MFGNEQKDEIIKFQMGQIDHLMKQNKELQDAVSKITITMAGLFDLAMENHKKKATKKGELSTIEATHHETVPGETTPMKKKHALKGRHQIQGTKITGPEAKAVKKTYHTHLVKERYNEIINHLLIGKRSLPELVALTGYKKFSIYAHLIYGEKIGEIKKLKGQMFYELSEGKIQELNKIETKN